jgi:ketosteroid isomerase-like protein
MTIVEIPIPATYQMVRTGKLVMIAGECPLPGDISTMNGQTNYEIAQEFLQKLGQGDAQDLACLFAEDAEWEVAGDAGALPWIGKKSGREAIVDFVRDTATLITRVRLDIHDLLANDRRAVVLGELASSVNATGKLIETAFALDLEISGGSITRFRMLEDSFAVSRATRSS